MAAHGSVGASANAVGSFSDQSGTRLNRVRAVTRPRQLPRRRESARHGRGPAIEMRLAAGRQLPVDLCPVRSSPRAFFFSLSLPLLTPSDSFWLACLETRTHAFLRHGDEKGEGVRVLNKSCFWVPFLFFWWFWKLFWILGIVGESDCSRTNGRCWLERNCDSEWGSGGFSRGWSDRKIWREGEDFFVKERSKIGELGFCDLMESFSLGMSTASKVIEILQGDTWNLVYEELELIIVS